MRWVKTTDGFNALPARSVDLDASDHNRHPKGDGPLRTGIPEMRPDYYRRGVGAACLAIVLVGLLAAGAAGAVTVGTDGDRAQQANEPPVATFEYSPTNPQLGETVSLNASASRDPDGDIVDYRWDLDGDGQTDVEGSPSARVAYPRAGVYTVSLTVVDDDGATNTTTRQIQVAGTQPPEAALSVTPQTVTVGETITLDPTGSSDPDGQLASWELDTDGDGTYDESFDSPTTLRTGFGEPGTYEVTLRVTDTDGMTDTATASVVVEAASPSVTDAPASPVDEASTPAGGGIVPDGGMPWLLAIGAGVVLLLIVAVGGIVARRGGSAALGNGLSVAVLGRLVASLVLVLVALGGPTYLIYRRFGSTPATESTIGVGLLQLVAFSLPALVILVMVLFRFVEQREDRSTSGLVIGPLTGDQFRWTVAAFGFISSVLAILGVVAVVAATRPVYPVSLAAGLIIAAIAVIPLAFAFVLVNLALGSPSAIQPGPDWP